MSVSTMKRLTAVTYTADADDVVRKLMNLRCVDIRSVPTGEGLAPFDLLS